LPSTVLNFRWPIELGLTVISHGWVHLAPWKWDPQEGRLARTEVSVIGLARSRWRSIVPTR